MKSLCKLTIMCFICSIFVSCNPDEGTTVDMLPSNVITKISIDKNGVKWIATDKGLVSFDGKKWTTYSKISTLYNKPTLDLLINESSSKKSLMTSNYEGVFTGLFSDQSVSESAAYRRCVKGLVCDTVNRLATNLTNTTFFGTPKGLSILKDTTWTFYDGQWGRKKDNFLTTTKITGIASAKNGWNYVSTEGQGVSCFKFVDAVTSATKYFLPWADGLNSDVVYTVIIVDDTCQWYGTDAGASYHTSNFTKGDWALHYSVADGGLASDSVYAIAKDVTNNIVWFGTQRGVSKLENNTITNFSTLDGLIDNKINTLSVDIDGSVWFGTNLGISHFKGGKWKSYSKK